VAIVNPVYWPEVRRGSERFAHELATGLVARGHAARIVAGHAGARTTSAMEDGVTVVRVPRLPEGRLRRRMFEDHLTHVPFAARALQRGDDDLVHALHATSAVAAARAGRPLVFSHMGIPHRQALANRRLRLDVMLRALRAADAVVALSETAARGFERWLGVSARVIHPGVDLRAFTPEPSARAEAPTFVCAASASEPRKRVPLLVEAFARVRRERPAARLVLSAPAAFDAPAGVEWRDLDSREALAAAYREAHVSVLPSWGEAFGLVLAEALACGTPVVGADREAIPEVVGDDARVGRLFSGEDPAELARVLLEALELAADPAVPAACRARAELFSTDRTTDAYVALYRELLA
jgi:UDP-glucose:tetrahydrobiopterin glucosyltransferase